MTPKEKAKELFDKFNCEDITTFAGCNLKAIAKQCALIAVDEIQDYWIQVKNEIEKL